MEDFLKHSDEQAAKQAEQRALELQKFTVMIKSEIDSAVKPVVDRQERFEEKTAQVGGFRIIKQRAHSRHYILLRKSIQSYETSMRAPRSEHSQPPHTRPSLL